MVVNLIYQGQGVRLLEIDGALLLESELTWTITKEMFDKHKNQLETFYEISHFVGDLIRDYFEGEK